MLQICSLFLKMLIVSAQVCTNPTLMKDIIEIDMKSKATKLLDIGETGIMQCMRSCLQYPLCTSINFINNKCTLLTGESNSLYAYPGAITSMKNNWPAERIAGKCFNKQCARNSKCVVYSFNQVVCEIIGCTDIPEVKNAQFLNVNVFQSKPLWNINDSIKEPCITPRRSSKDVLCQSNGQWSDFNCSLPVDCRDAHSRNMNLSLDIDIDLDGENGVLSPISVKCEKMSESDEFQVTLGHESGVLRAYGHEVPYSQKLLVTYKANMEAVTQLIDRSKSCKQMISVICHNTVIVRNMAWINRRNSLSYYFTGNDVEYIGCSCGLTNTCVMSIYYKCNCDANDNTINTDTGEVTNKNDLPVLGVAVGDTGSFIEYANISIGSLICLQ